MNGLTANMRGALFMMGSMLSFTFNDAFMKSLAGEVPLFQAIFVRGVATSVFLLVIAWRLGAFKTSISRKDWTIILWRALAEVLAAYFFISALFNMNFANVSAILQALPLCITLAGAIFLREPVGWRRMGAILIGFFGVLLIVQPGGDDFNSYSVYAILSVIAVTFRDLAARRLSGSVPSMIVALSAAFMVTASAGLAAVTQPWVTLSQTHVLHLGGTVFFVIGGYLFSVMAMRVGDISFVAPFRYVSLVGAIALGAVVFGERPGWLTLIGAAIVVATGLFTLFRERGVNQRASHVGLRVR